jgi:tripartite-type tricarboxylate transporter receptor subunit TctC
MQKKLILFLLMVMVSLPVAAGHAAEYYEGKTMKLIVSTKPGGGYDLYGRMMAKYMQKYMPGSKIIVKNRPGAGHIIGCSEIFHSKPDGMTFGTFNRALPMAQMAELKGVKFDLPQMSWLGSPASDLYILVMVKKFKTVDDVRTAPEVKLASAGLGSQANVTAELFKKMMGFDNIKVIPGYGGGEAELAMMRGEVDGVFASLSSLMSFIEEGNGNIILFIGKSKAKGYENLPLLSELVTDPAYKPVVGFLNTLNVLARPYAGPPGIPADRLKILREAFNKSCKDPEFLSFAEKSGVPIDLTEGEEAQELVSSMMTLSPDVKKIIKEAYQSGE